MVRLRLSILSLECDQMDVHVWEFEQIYGMCEAKYDIHGALKTLNSHPRDSVAFGSYFHICDRETSGLYNCITDGR